MKCQTLNRRRHRGSVLVEFAIVSIFLIPILLSMITIGLNTSRAIQVNQVARDAASMYARNVDFSVTANKNILIELTSGLGVTATGGQGTIVLSKVTYLSAADCTAGGYDTGSCTNMDRYIIRNRIVIGNPDFHASSIGTPGPTSLQSNGDAIDIYTDASLQSNNFSTNLALSPGEYAFVVETFFKGLAWTVPSSGVGTLLSARYYY